MTALSSQFNKTKYRNRLSCFICISAWLWIVMCSTSANCGSIQIFDASSNISNYSESETRSENDSGDELVRSSFKLKPRFSRIFARKSFHFKRKFQHFTEKKFLCYRVRLNLQDFSKLRFFHPNLIQLEHFRYFVESVLSSLV